MKKQHLFTLDINLVKKLHKQVNRGWRSNFVERAIRKALDNDLEYDIEDVATEKLLQSLAFRYELSAMQKELVRQMYLEVKK